MNIHFTIPDEQAKAFDAACVAKKESWEQFAQRVVLAAIPEALPKDLDPDEPPPKQEESPSQKQERIDHKKKPTDFKAGG